MSPWSAQYLLPPITFPPWSEDDADILIYSDRGGWCNGQIGNQWYLKSMKVAAQFYPDTESPGFKNDYAKSWIAAAQLVAPVRIKIKDEDGKKWSEVSNNSEFVVNKVRTKLRDLSPQKKIHQESLEKAGLKKKKNDKTGPKKKQKKEAPKELRVQSNVIPAPPPPVVKNTTQPAVTCNSPLPSSVAGVDSPTPMVVSPDSNKTILGVASSAPISERHPPQPVPDLGIRDDGTLGRAVGIADGEVIGDSDGRSDGDVLGRVEGPPLGLRLGDPDRTHDGFALGRGEGATVGVEEDGRDVGSIEGSELGILNEPFDLESLQIDEVFFENLNPVWDL